MRAAILSVALALVCPVPGLAETLKPIDCGARQGCERAFLIEGFQSLDARPVALPGDRIALLGVDGLGEDDSLWRLDPSIADGLVSGAVEVEIDAQELSLIRAAMLEGRVVRAEIAPDGLNFALFLHESEGPALRFFGASGKPMGLVQPPYAAPWPAPQNFEWTPVDLFLRFAGMNALRFDDLGLHLDYPGLSLLADAQTGAVTITGTGALDADAMVRILDPAIDPVGAESYWFGRDLTAATNYPADGFEAQLAVLLDWRDRFPYALPPKPDRGDRVLDGNEAIDYVLTFAEMTLTPDDRRLAVLRRADAGTILQVYDTASGQLTFASDLPSDPGNGSTLVWADNGALVHVLRAEAGIELYVYQP